MLRNGIVGSEEQLEEFPSNYENATKSVGQLDINILFPLNSTLFLTSILSSLLNLLQLFRSPSGSSF